METADLQVPDRALRRLAGAMLICAFDDLLSFSHARRHSARDWIVRQGSDALSFDFCCAVVGFDAERIRHCIAESICTTKSELGRVVAERTQKGDV